MVSYVLHSSFIHTNLCTSVANLYNLMFTHLHVASQWGKWAAFNWHLFHTFCLLIISTSHACHFLFSYSLSISFCIFPGQITGIATLEFTDLSG